MARVGTLKRRQWNYFGYFHEYLIYTYQYHGWQVTLTITSSDLSISSRTPCNENFTAYKLQFTIFWIFRQKSLESFFLSQMVPFVSSGFLQLLFWKCPPIFTSNIFKPGRQLLNGQKLTYPTRIPIHSNTKTPLGILATEHASRLPYWIQYSR